MSRHDSVISEAEHQQFRCVHRLEELDPKKENGFRYRCLKCGKFMLKLNGVLVRPLKQTGSVGMNEDYPGREYRDFSHVPDKLRGMGRNDLLLFSMQMADLLVELAKWYPRLDDPAISALLGRVNSILREAGIEL